MTKIIKYLGIDYGSSKVGLAMAESETRIAFALDTLENNENFIQKITEIITEKHMDTVIIGVPSYMNKKNVEYAGEVLGKKLKNLIPELNIEYQNEMFTTKMAQEKLKEKGIKNIKRFDNQEAARIILQNWLDSLKKRSA